LTQVTDSIKKLLEDCTLDERKEVRLQVDALVPHPLEVELKTDASTILDAINRSGDIGKRGIRGLVAEAVFERDALPAAKAVGWMPVVEKTTNPLFDFHLERDGHKVRFGARQE
jgi:hypothetical protein